MRFPTAILAKHFVDAARLESTKQDGVPLFATSREPKAAFARLEDFCASHEAAGTGLDMCVRIGTTTKMLSHEGRVIPYTSEQLP